MSQKQPNPLPHGKRPAPPPAPPKNQAATTVLECPSFGLAEFIERCCRIELKPWQREFIAAMERREKLKQ